MYAASAGRAKALALAEGFALRPADLQVRMQSAFDGLAADGPAASSSLADQRRGGAAPSPGIVRSKRERSSYPRRGSGVTHRGRRSAREGRRAAGRTAGDYG